jgi:hypothetical protein
MLAVLRAPALGSAAGGQIDERVLDESDFFPSPIQTMRPLSAAAWP